MTEQEKKGICRRVFNTELHLAGFLNPAELFRLFS